MMKKLLILMLVLGMTTLASASPITISLEYRDAAGTTPISVVDVSVSTSFTLIVIGTYVPLDADVVRLYDDFENLSIGTDLADMTGATQFAAAGGGGLISPYDPVYDGYFLYFGDPSTGQTNADMFKIDLSVIGGATSGTMTFSNVASDYTTVLNSASIGIIPEPMTIALLGLGSLFLLRRRK